MFEFSAPGWLGWLLGGWLLATLLLTLGLSAWFRYQHAQDEQDAAEGRR